MKLYMKIGPHPATYVYAPRLRKLPVIGQWVTIIEEPNMQPTKVLVDAIGDIDGQPLYFAAR